MAHYLVSMLGNVPLYYPLVHSDISELRRDIVGGIGQRETKLESAVKILADTEGGNTRSLVDDILAEVRMVSTCFLVWRSCTLRFA